MSALLRLLRRARPGRRPSEAKNEIELPSASQVPRSRASDCRTARAILIPDGNGNMSDLQQFTSGKTVILSPESGGWRDWQAGLDGSCPLRYHYACPVFPFRGRFGGDFADLS